MTRKPLQTVANLRRQTAWLKLARVGPGARRGGSARGQRRASWSRGACGGRWVRRGGGVEAARCASRAASLAPARGRAGSQAESEGER
eukprot:2656563-Rhodomonas_salina.1